MQTESPKADPPKRKRRRFQFSLRTLLIFTLVVAVACAWLGRKIEQKRREREAVEAIVKKGGVAWYEMENGIEKPAGPDWLRNLLGEDFFSEVQGVDFYHRPVTDSELGFLKTLTTIQTLNLESTRVTDAGLANLEGLIRLTK